MKVLIGYDGSSCANAAVADLQRAGLPANTEAIVMSVADVWLPPDDQSIYDLLPDTPLPAVAHSRQEAFNALEEAVTASTEAAQLIRKLFPSWQIHTEASTDSPAWALVKKAEDWDIDLIVVGSRGHSQFDRLLLGSVSQIVVGNARCSVRVGRLNAHEANQPVRIIVGYDGSHHANHAVQTVAERDWPLGSEVELMIAADKSMVTAHPWLLNRQPIWLPQHSRESFKSGVDWVAKMADAAAGDLRKAGLRTTVVVHEGDPRTVLIEEAQSWRADSIFVGARGLGRFERILLGSVSTAIASRAPCSVEIIRCTNE